MNIQAIIFDLDGVIVSTDTYHYRSWKQIADEESIYFDENINNRLRGVSRMESLEIVLERAARIYTAEEKQALADRKNGIYVSLLELLTPLDVLTGFPEVLERLREREFKVAIGSSSKNAKLILRKIGLADAFDAVADGTDITRSKPFPDVFLTASEKLGIPPAQCLVVEDAVAGIQAAKAAGMSAAAIGDATKSTLADFSFSSILELISILCLNSA